MMSACAKCPLKSASSWLINIAVVRPASLTRIDSLIVLEGTGVIVSAQHCSRDILHYI